MYNFAKIETVSIAQKEGQLFWLKTFFQVEESYVDLLRWEVVIWIAMKVTINVDFSQPIWEERIL